MYPTVAILLVESQRSMMDFCEISRSNASKLVGPVALEAQPATSGNLRFAVRRLWPVHCTMDDKAKSQRLHTLQDHCLEQVILEVKES